MSNYNNKHLKNAATAMDDEFYTLKEQVECLFNKFLKYKMFENKIVYLPFDGEQSNILKFFRENKQILKYKQLINTSDDYRNHEDLFIKADIIFSNPPFSLMNKDILPFLEKYNKKFCLFWTVLSYCQRELMNFDRYKVLELAKYNLEKYLRPDGSFSEVQSIVFTNIDGAEDDVVEIDKWKLFYRKKADYYDDETKLAVFKHKTDIPKLYNKEFFVPFIRLYKYREYIEILGLSRNVRINGQKMFSYAKCRLKLENCKFKHPGALF